MSAGAQGGRVVLVVEDSGPGIPPAERGRLFDRFRRATDHPDGAGLGLAIADSVVRTTGGRWRVADSALGGALMEVSWRRSGSPGRTSPPAGSSTDSGDGAGVWPAADGVGGDGGGATSDGLAPTVDA